MKVEMMRGDLTIRIYAPNAVYKTWYNPKHNVALYGREEWSEADQRIRLKPAWRDEILRVICSNKARIHVLYKDGVAAEEWFGPESDMKPLKDAYDYIMTVEKQAKDAIESLLASAGQEED